MSFLGAPPPGFPPPGPPGPPMMGGMPPPGMVPPTMTGPPPSLAPGELPPQPPPEQPIPDGKWFELVEVLRQIVAQHGEEYGRELLAVVPQRTLRDFVNAVDSDPDAIGFLYTLLPDDPHPIYPRGFTPPRKPKEKEVEAIAESDRGLWLDVINRMAEDLRIYHMEVVGKTLNFDDTVDEEFHSPALSDEVRAIASMTGTADIAWDFVTERPESRDDAQRVKDALRYWEDESRRRYARANSGDFGIDAALYLLTTGYVAWQCALNLYDPYLPFREGLVDPATTFPTWDADGLVRVTRRYTATIAQVVSDYDPDGTRKIESKLTRMTKGKNGPRYQLTDTIEVTTYHDRWWVCVLAGGKAIIKPTPHKLGYVPYVIQGSTLGEPMGITSSPFVSRHRHGSISHTFDRLKYKNVSYFHFRKWSHAQREVMLSKLYTLLQNADKPAYILEKDALADDEDPVIDDRPGKVIKIDRQHESLSPLISAVDQRVWGALFNAMGQDDATNRLPASFFGIAQSANESGNALEGLYEAGKDKLAGIVRALETFHTLRGEMRLKMYRDWGHLVENDDGEFGMVPVPHDESRQRMWGYPSSFKLQPESIIRSGCHISASIVHVRLQNLAPLGNAASIWMQLGGMSAREAMRLRGVHDPDAVMRERLYEKAMLDENMEKARMMAVLKRMDPEAFEMFKELNAPQGSGPPGLVSPPGLTPDVNTNAMDMTALGLGPQGPTGRPSMMPPESGIIDYPNPASVPVAGGY